MPGISLIMSSAEKSLEKSIDVVWRAEVEGLSAQNVISEFRN
jgi:hypothetical protein